MPFFNYFIVILMDESMTSLKIAFVLRMISVSQFSVVRTGTQTQNQNRKNMCPFFNHSKVSY